MILLFGMVLAVLSVPLTGGSYLRLLDAPLRWPGLVLGSLVVVVLTTEVLHATLDEGILTAVNGATYLAGAAFLVLNRHLPGMKAVLAGAGCNVLAMSLNGWSMPVSAWAAEVTAKPLTPGEYINVSVQPDATLLPLGDVLVIPLPFPWGGAFSVGDVLILGGVLLATYRLSRKAPAAWGAAA